MRNVKTKENLSDILAKITADARKEDRNSKYVQAKYIAIKNAIEEVDFAKMNTGTHEFLLHLGKHVRYNSLYAKYCQFYANLDY